MGNTCLAILLCVHMTLTSSSLILTRAARSSFQSHSRSKLSSTPILSKLAIIRKMSDTSKTKSDEEWRAILTPEQVCLSQGLSHPGTPSHASEHAVQGAPLEGHRATWHGG